MMFKNEARAHTLNLEFKAGRARIEVLNLKKYKGCYKSGKRDKYYCVDYLKCLVFDTCIKDDDK